MIRNERQYRISKAQLAKFADAIASLAPPSGAPSLAPIMRIQAEALRSQHDDLKTEIEQYEALLHARPAWIEARTLSELPHALIRARIAMGLTQKDLADRLELSEQQVQRYESTDYGAASLTRLREVAEALQVRVGDRLFLPLRVLDADALYQKLDEAGCDSDFVDRILPQNLVDGLHSDSIDEQRKSTESALDVFKRLFGWTSEGVRGTAELEFPLAAAATARFKIPAGRPGRRVRAYIAYAHYLSLVVANATTDLSKAPLANAAAKFPKSMARHARSCNLRGLIEGFWDHGVPVLPLDDAGVFHGACWRTQGRNVIVLKHRTKFLSRWIFDLIHEWCHAAQHPKRLNHSWIEEGEFTSSRRNSDEEQEANQFSGNVVLDSRAEELTQQCMERTDGDLRRFKSAIVAVARTAGVSVDHLANYIAWRLSLQNQNFWGTASNLQTKIGDAMEIARTVFCERFDFGKIDPIDSQLLIRAIDGGVN